MHSNNTAALEESKQSIHDSGSNLLITDWGGGGGEEGCITT